MRFIAFDIETTGFLPGADKIVELAAVKFEDGKPVDAYASLVDPGSPIPVEVQRVHGINDQMVAGKPKIEEVLEKFTAFAQDTVLVAHNAPFDVEFIKASVTRFETSAPKGIILDSCSMARKVLPGFPNYKLGTLVTHLKIPGEPNFHRAEADARFCGYIFATMLGRIFRAGEPVILENLMNLSAQVQKFPQIQRTYRQLDLLAQL